MFNRYSARCVECGALVPPGKGVVLMKCRNCKHNTLLEEDGEQFSWCVAKHDNLDIDEERDCEHFEKATNAQQIRAMSDEMLARLCCSACDCLACPPEVKTSDCDPTKYLGCFKNWVEWLKSEVDE